MPAMASGSKSKTAQRFPAEIVAKLREGKGLCIRAGTGDHRFIGIWVVVVKDRVFVRSWSVKPDGWYRTFLEEPYGTIRIGDRDIRVMAVGIRDKRILNAIDRAYLEKYNTPGAIKYAQDLASPQSRAATLELRPLPPRRQTSPRLAIGPC
jgi:hypothetical protein